MDENQNQNQVDKIVDIKLEKEMQDSYISYAMSVIIARALPDARDGLKPVHRRILYAMNELNLDPSKAYKKSARIVGDTMGKYHPHGDSSIYDAMVRMAQDFSMRYPLVDGHGNFGSMDGDGAAAQRYTEARLSRIAMEMLQDIEKDTVEFEANYDGEFKEPVVLPSRIPNLLVNGSSGIAVGMATNIPPHNLREVIDGVVRIIDDRLENNETDIADLLQIIKGPDFPTGASIMGTSGIRQAYRTGRGKVSVRATASIEDINGRDTIIITEIPYQVNKAKLIEKMADLVKDKRVEGISDIRDETDRNGVRVVVEVKKDANAHVILNQLYKYSPLQETFGVIMLALVDKQAKILNLKEALDYYLEHQKDVVTRRTKFELEKARKRAHILEGLLIAVNNIDEVVQIVRSSKTRPEVRERLMERFELSEEQARAIDELQLGRLSGLEREKIQDEYNGIMELIKELQSILDDERRLYNVIKEEILIVKTKYGDDRRTAILTDANEIEDEDLIDEEMNAITMTHYGYIKRLALKTYRSQNRGGKGIIGMQMRDEDFVNNLFVANTHDYILYFTNQGRLFRTKTYEIPEAGRVAKGMAIVNLLNLNEGEKINAVIPVKDYLDGEYLMMITRKGVVKKTEISQFQNVRKGGLIALHLRDDDELISVLKTDGNKNIFIATKNGMGIRFSEDDIRPMGRTAAGVRGIRLRGGDKVVGAELMEEGYKILFVSEKGYGKCTKINEFNLQRRGGKGVKIYRITDKTGCIVGISSINDNEEMMLITSEGVIIRIRVKEISTSGRVAQGVKLINLDENIQLMSIAKIAEDELEQEEEVEQEQEQDQDQDQDQDQEQNQDQDQEQEEALEQDLE